MGNLGKGFLSRAGLARRFRVASWPLPMYLYLLMSHGDVDDVVYGLPLYEVWGVI